MFRLQKFTRVMATPAWAVALIRYLVAASAEHVSALSGLRCAVVVDIGANRGQFSLLARGLNPVARIYAFEPLPEAAARYRTVFARDPGVTLHEAAIGTRTGQAAIHISRCDDSSSLLPITSTQAALFAGTKEVGTTMVKVAPLDEFLTPEQIIEPALLKLDVQGYELEALKGCETLLDRFAYAYVECSFMELYAGQALADEVVGWLQKRGFQLCGVYNMSYYKGGRAVQGDFLFSRA